MAVVFTSRDHCRCETPAVPCEALSCADDASVSSSHPDVLPCRRRGNWIYTATDDGDNNDNNATHGVMWSWPHTLLNSLLHWPGF